MEINLMRIKLQRVRYMPPQLEPGVLYVSEEFGTAAHLCACGCGSKVRTPLGDTEWAVEETESGPTLRPSVGNWQLPCESHYWIEGGKVIWSGKWTPEEVLAGRHAEEERRTAYYAGLETKRHSVLQRLWNWVVKLLKH